MKLRSLPLVALLTAACGTGPGSGQEGTEGETGDPEPLEPACEIVWEWALRVDGLDTPYPYANLGNIDIDAAGNVYVVSSHGIGMESIIWIGKWTADGTQDWSRTISEPGSGRGVQVGLDGELFVLGSLGPQLWLARLDPETGDELWSDTVDAVQAADLARTPSGQLIVLGLDSSERQPWLSERNPADGSAVWTRNDPVMLASDQLVDGVEQVAVSDTGELRVAGGWESNLGQPNSPPPRGGMLLRYDAQGVPIDVTLADPTDDWSAFVLDADIYQLRTAGSDNLASLDPQLEQRWSIDGPAWAVAEQPSALEIIGLAADTLEIGGTIDRPGGGQAVWTATVERETGMVTRRCAHEVADPDSGRRTSQDTYTAVSHPNGGLVVFGDQSTFDPELGEITSPGIWLRHIAGD